MKQLCAYVFLIILTPVIFAGLIGRLAYLALITGMVMADNLDQFIANKD